MKQVFPTVSDMIFLGYELVLVMLYSRSGRSFTEVRLDLGSTICDSQRVV